MTPGVTYPLAESGGDPNYVQDVAQNANPIPGSTGSWGCVQVDAGGNVIPGFSDGLNGGVTVPLGIRVRCTAINRTVDVVLQKVVKNNFGGTATPADWNLTVTPTGTPPAGVVAQTVTGSLAGASIHVRPGQNYSLSENPGPAGYTLASLSCNGVNETSFTLQISSPPTTCTFTNRDVQPTLTLVKTVDNNNGSGTALPTDWTLTATGPSRSRVTGVRSGRTGDRVNAGTYNLTETGPTGYTASGWTCTGVAVSTATSVTIAPGENAICTINNTAIRPTLTLIKTVTNGNGGTAIPPRGR